MKTVFEVTCEYSEEGSKEIITERQYVTCDDNTIKPVVDYFTEYCEQYGRDLIAVRAVLNITNHIKVESNDF